MSSLSKPVIGPFSFVSLLAAMNAFLLLSYVALIAVVMSYAALHVEFAQSVRSDEAAVATLESEYFATLGTITVTDYESLGYAKPVAKTFVVGGTETAFHSR